MNTPLNLELGVVQTNEPDSNYPSPSLESILTSKIKEKIIRHTGIKVFPVIGAGSDQLLERLAFVLSSNENIHILPRPCYFSHEEYLEKNNAAITEFEYDLHYPETDIIKKIHENNNIARNKNKFLWITTPHNPTGITINTQSLLGLADYIIVDEAYGEFSDITPFSSSAISQMNNNIIVLRSFSKGLRLAGTRLGYLLTNNEQLAEALRISLPLFPFSRNSLEKGIETMDNYEEISENTRRIGAERRNYFISQLKELKQHLNYADITLNYMPPKAITCMAWAENERGPLELHDYLARNGIIVQNLAGIKGIPKKAIRITMAEKEKTDYLMETLGRIANNKPKIIEYI